MNTPGDVVALEFLKIAEVAVHKALVYSEHPTIREHAEAARLQLADAAGREVRPFARQAKHVHHLRSAPVQGSHDDLGPVA